MYFYNTYKIIANITKIVKYILFLQLYIKLHLNRLNKEDTNNGFYNIAFTEEEKIYINKTLVDNSQSSTAIMTNTYVCEDTNDYLYLLSYKDVINSTYGFDLSNRTSTLRQAIVSDYTKSKNCFMDSGSGYVKGRWWLRSPNYNNSNYVRNVNYNGNVDNN